MSAVTLRVVIVDDHPMFRMGLAAAIAEMGGIEVVGEAECADEVADLVADVSPDVVLLDVRLPDGSGLEVNRWLARHHPAVKVVMLTMSEDEDTALTALHDGASAYLVKGAGPDRVEHALRSVAAGNVVLDQALRPAVTELARARRSEPVRAFPQLTNREFDCLALLADGLNNEAIARRMCINSKTVRNYVTTIFAKLHVSDRPGAIVLARQHGLGT